MSSTPNQPGANAPGAFVSMTQPPITHFITGNVPAPTSVYIADDAFLRMQIQNLFPGLNVTITTRTLRAEDGVVVTAQDTVTPTSDGAINTFTFPLTEGFLLSVVLTTPGVTASLRGMTFCNVTLCQGSTADLRQTQLLIQDYMQGGYAVGWPGGLFRSSIEGPGAIIRNNPIAPGVGAEINFVMPGNVRWRLLCFKAVFNTSAAVANRLPRLLVGIGGAFYAAIPLSAVIPASIQANIVWSASMGYAAVTSSATTMEFTAPLPEDLIMDNLDSILTSTVAIQGADQYSVLRILAEQWIRG